MPLLRLMDGPGAPKDFVLEHLHPLPGTNGLLIGRDERYCAIHLTHPYVSRRHAMIREGARGLNRSLEELIFRPLSRVMIQNPGCRVYNINRHDQEVVVLRGA